MKGISTKVVLDKAAYPRKYTNLKGSSILKILAAMVNGCPWFNLDIFVLTFIPLHIFVSDYKYAYKKEGHDVCPYP